MDFQEENDLKADFLAREQAAMKELGEDLFLAPAESIKSPVLESVNTFNAFEAKSSPSSIPAPSIQTFATASLASPKMSAPQSEVSSMKSPVINNTLPSPSESEAIKKWKLEFEKKIQERDAANTEKHNQVIAQAKVDLDKFYADYEKIKANKSSLNKQEEEQLYAAQANSSSWAQVYAQIESITKTKNAKDTSRMKAILFALKNDVKAE